MADLKSRIRERNQIFSEIRDFFQAQNVLEVDTSLLRDFSVTDPYMSAFSVRSPSGQHQGYLQTSPEYAMKKLICGGSGDIYQMSKMFRADEKGQIHSSEFTMLEWYRMGYDHFELMQNVCQLLEKIVGKREINIITYRDAFLSILKIDPFSISLDALRKISISLLGDIPQNLLFDNYLSLLFSEKIETSFASDHITIVHGFPASQASLAKITTENGITTANRFEVYLQGMELANGFNELTNAIQQRQRFEQDNQIRTTLGLKEIAIDEEFISALESGLPVCAGVALGVDRLLMIKLGKSDISDVLLD